MAEDSRSVDKTRRARKACTECRQQKVRCNVDAAEGGVCSRCQRMNLRCVISDPFKRQHKHKRLSELEHEASALRRRLDNGDHASSNFSIAMLAAAAGIDSENAPQGYTEAASMPSSSTPLSNATTISTANGIENQYDETLPRTLDGVTVDALIIDDSFRSYFKLFHPFLPVINHVTIESNRLYEHSPFLFWAVVGTGCRVLNNTSALVESLGPKIIDLAFLSLKDKPNFLSKIKGILIVLTWPFPSPSLTKDVPFPLAGAMIHMAMQIGLHVPLSSQDFSRVKIRLTQDEMNRRAGVWAFCMIVYQRACFHMGIAPLGLLGLVEDMERSHVMSMVPDRVRFQLEIHSLVTKCLAAVIDNGIKVMSLDQERSLNIVLRIFESQLKTVEMRASTDVDKLYAQSARLMILNFHWFKAPENIGMESLIRLYTSSITVIDTFDQMNKKKMLEKAGPHFFGFCMFMAVSTLLRMLKTSFSQYLDIAVAKDAMCHGIELLKCIGNELMAAKSSVILMQIYGSDKAFRNPDGSEHAALRLRSCLMLSPIYDTVWWWREEFGGQGGAYTQTEESSSNNGTTAVDYCAVPPMDMVSFPMDVNWIEPFLDDRLLADLGWSATDPSLFAPMSTAYAPPGFSTVMPSQPFAA